MSADTQSKRTAQAHADELTDDALESIHGGAINAYISNAKGKSTFGGGTIQKGRTTEPSGEP